MKVTLNAPVTLGNRPYAAGPQEIPDHLYANQAFVKAVKAGQITVHPRDKAAQHAQASKDARAMQKAQAIKRVAAQAIAARSLMTNQKQIQGQPAPISQADKEAAKAAAAPVAEAALAPATSSAAAPSSPPPVTKKGS